MLEPIRRTGGTEALIVAPLAMAVDYGREAGVSVIGFNRKGCFNANSYPDRVACKPWQ